MNRRDNDPTDIIPPPPTLRFASVEVTVSAGPDEGLRLRLSPGITRVGAAPSCGLRLSDTTVSRLHCEIHVESDRVRVVDCDSTNGTLVDGVRVQDAWLARGTTIEVGKTTLRVDIGERPLMLTLVPRDRFGRIVGSSAEMRRLYAIVERVAPTDGTVLIQGETGTGKELVALAIHEASKRASGPFVAVDCATIPDSLVESELFGHVQGAFAGAVADRAGLFEQADGGTLFLDQIGDLPMSVQPALLRVLETREARRVGSYVPRKLDVRILAATHQSLPSRVNAGTFRDDLYYRLAVIEITLPALRARRQDIPALANHFFRSFTGSEDDLPPEVLTSLSARSWPGNVRELRNFVERMVCLGWSSSETNIAPEPPPAPVLDGLLPLHLPLKDARVAWTAQLEKLYVAALLRRMGGNVTRSAAVAGVTRRYLQRLMAEQRIRGYQAEDGEGGGPEDV